MGTSMRKWLGIGLAAALLTGIATTSTTDAEASQVQALGKGTAGGALLGAEVGFLGLSAFGARSAWLYGTVPTALAIGGGVGGYYLDKSIGDGDAKPVMYMLAGGMLLVVPTIVITLSATATTYTSEDVPAADAGVKPAPGAGEGTSVTPPPKTSLRHVEPIRPAIPPSFALVNFDQQVSPRVSVPAVEVAPMYSSVELSKFGGAQRWQFSAPLVAVTF